MLCRKIMTIKKLSWIQVAMARARYKSLVDSFAADIRAGRLTPGTRLPTHRQLAAQERMSLVTASRVYAELEAMGLVSGEAGRGTFVREISLPPGLGIDQQAVATDMLDLNFNYPTLSSQSELLRAALRQLASSGDLDALLRYQTPCRSATRAGGRSQTSEPPWLKAGGRERFAGKWRSTRVSHHRDGAVATGRRGRG
ncbi:transcriptional regulatory protein PtsJ [Serratia fonticola]|uniref:Transcriptional regulatory protein PtsJ n=1 Tax=Serratia fonticola TaxID=47917 RepID=A0A4U9VV44_SERFO|nr:transcriptional regulatory protein PtsJ [Serratia fonticola]